MAAASRWSPAAIAFRIVSTSRSCGARLASRNPLMRSLRMRADSSLRASSLTPVPAGERIDYHCQVVPLGQQGEDLVRRSHFPCARAGAHKDVSFPPVAGPCCRCRCALRRNRLARVAVSFASIRAGGRRRVFLSGSWPLTLSDIVSRGRDSSPRRRLSMPAGWSRAGWARRCASGAVEKSLLPAVSLARIRLQAIDRGDSKQRCAAVTRIDIPALDDVACLSVIGQRGKSPSALIFVPARRRLRSARAARAASQRSR